LIFGIIDKIPGKKALQGCINYDPDEIKRMVYENTRPRLTVDVDAIMYGGKSFVTIVVDKSKRIHATSDGKRYRRVGKDTQLIYPDEDIEVEISKGGDFTGKFMSGLDWDDLDVTEIGRLKLTTARIQKNHNFESMNDRDFLIAIGLGGTDSQENLRPNIGALLLCGKQGSIEQKIAQAEICFVHYKTDTVLDKQEFIRLPILQAIERIVELCEPYNTEITIRTGLEEIPIQRMPEEVLREALLNALTHRDYSVDGAIYIRIYKDRTEIGNPGGFVGDITPENILYHEPRSRNRTLADALLKMGLVNRAGVGVDRIYNYLLSNGKEPPIYTSTGASVTLIVRDEVNESFAKFIAESVKKGTTYGLDEIVILSHLVRNIDIGTREAAILCQRSPAEIKEKLIGMHKRGILDCRGKTKGQVFSLTRKIYEQMEEGIQYSKEKGIDRMRYREMILGYLKDNPQITSFECQNLCGIGGSQAYQLLKKMCDEDVLEIHGSTKSAHYTLKTKSK